MGSPAVLKPCIPDSRGKLLQTNDYVSRTSPGEALLKPTEKKTVIRNEVEHLGPCIHLAGKQYCSGYGGIMLLPERTEADGLRVYALQD